MHHTIIHSLDKETTIITANNRLALELIADFAAVKDKPILEKPSCLPYRVFLQQLFNKFCQQNTEIPTAILLSEQQTRHLWIKILSASLDSTPNKGLIDAVIESWRRCQQWQLSYESPQFQQNSQTIAFQSWVEAFNLALKELDAITDYHLVSYIVATGRPLPIKKCLWYCFDDYTPEQRCLQAYLIEHGTEISYEDLTTEATQAYNFAAADETDEWKHVIEWLQMQLQRGKQKIGVVVPSLEAEATKLQRLFNRHLKEGSFVISLGKTLSDYPLISHALTWLSFDKEILSNQEIRLLLHSPYLKEAKMDFLARTQMLQDSKLLEAEQISFTTFIEAFKKVSPNLAEQLKNLSDYPKNASVDEWATLFATRLHCLGFPGDYAMDSYSYQCYQRFLLVFDAFKQIAFLSPTLSKEEALSNLNQLAESIIFQPKIKPTVIRVLGLLEASGCLFDSLWITGLTDQCLPQKAKLTPFIPFSLQKEKNMPHANPEKEFRLAEKQLLRLKNSGKTTIFSYPKFTQDTPNLPSPLLFSLETFKATLHSSKPAISELESFTEFYQQPLEETKNLKATTSLLANQAKCPFKAFAAHRLHAKAASSISNGLTEQTRGDIVHKVMELLMFQLQSQQKLLSFCDEDLATLIQACVEQALSPYHTALKPLLKKLETKRLQRLVIAYLAWEKQRPPFFVEAVEKPVTLQLAGIEFNLRVDRIDESLNGDKWVIDYKSSLPSILPWNDQRPREPQLLLYALLDEAITTLIFAALKNGQLKTAGLSAKQQTTEGIASLKANKNWVDERLEWKEKLSELAIEFREGHCAPQPISTVVCQFCEFGALCRISTATS